MPRVVRQTVVARKSLALFLPACSALSAFSLVLPLPSSLFPLLSCPGGTLGSPGDGEGRANRRTMGT